MAMVYRRWALYSACGMECRLVYFGAGAMPFLTSSVVTLSNPSGAVRLA